MSARDERTEANDAAASKSEPSTAVASPAPQPPTASSLGDLRAEMLRSGWKQGSVLPPDLVGYVQAMLGADLPLLEHYSPDDAWYVVATQDCDLVHGDVQLEPAVEVVLARKVASLETQYADVRDPRHLHVELTRADNSPQPVAIRIRDRGWIRRELLCSATPSDSLSADKKATARIAAMLGRRYVREARPESFERRLGAARNKLKQLLETEASVLQDIYFELPEDQHMELPPGEWYDCRAYGILRGDLAGLPGNKIAGIKNRIRNRLRDIMTSCQANGIVMIEPSVVTRYDISLGQLDHMLRLDLGWPDFVPRADRESVIASEERTIREAHLAAVRSLREAEGVDGDDDGAFEGP